MATETNPLTSLSNTIAFRAKDYSLNHHDAWVYGIVLGWDEPSYKELQQKHGWTDADISRLKRLRSIYKKMQRDFNLSILSETINDN